MNTRLVVIVVLIIVVIWGFSLTIDKDTIEVEVDNSKSLTIMMREGEISEDEMMKEVDSGMVEAMMEIVYEYSGDLADVTGGESSGVAKANYKDGQYNLLVTFENLPEPVGTDFYEGWIVRKGVNFDVISSGVVNKVEDVYTNLYASLQDLTDHSFYVLTLEPDDGDPAPAKHIVEGTLVK